MFADELRLAVRGVMRRWRTTAVAVLLLALGVTATVVLFALSDAVMFRRFPFAAQGELVVAAEQLPAAPRAEVSYANYRDWRVRARAFQDVAALGSTNWTFTMRTAEPVTLPYRAVSANFFDVLGAHAALGRTFRPDDDARGAVRVVIISDGLWRRQFGTDPRIVGRQLRLSERPFTVVGVMPRGFTYPAAADAWTPLVPALADIRGPSLPDFVESRTAAVLHVIGRMKPGVTVSAARADLDRVIRELSVEFARTDRVTSTLTPLVDDLLGSVRFGLWALLFAVGLLLLAVVANVAGLLLVQVAARRREFAIRLALGESTAHVMRQLLIECGLLVAAATICAIVLARVALPAIQSLVAASIPRADQALVDWRVIAFTVALALVTCAACWMVPALALHRLAFDAGVRQIDRGAASSALSRAGRRWLVGTEIATAMIVLTAAALLYRSVDRLGRLDLGFKPGNLLAVELAPPDNVETSGSRADVYEFYTRAIEHVARLPFVESVAAVGQRPLKGPIGLDAQVQIEERAPGAATEPPWVNLEPVTPAYFATIGSPLTAGRAFDDGDRIATQRVIIVNEKLARYAWPDESAIGKRLRGGALNLGQSSSAWWTVVGVVPDIRYRDIQTTSLDVYVPFAQSWFAVGDLMIRTKVPPATVAPTVRARLRDIDPDGLIDIAPMDRIVAANQAAWRTNLLLFAAFALLTMLVACVGLYAMLAATVAERMRDIGVRAAMGATATRIAREVIGDALQTVVPAIAVGLAVVAASGQMLRSVLFEVSPLDHLSVIGAAGALLVVAVAASALPAVRAARVDPAACLRSE